MASKPIDPRPVALPNLSRLPDPTKDLLGGMTSPTALMSMSEKEVNDLFSVKPLTDMHIKPSAEAAKALQTAQNLQNDISRQATQMYEQQVREQAERAERLTKEAEARAKANYAYAEQMRKEREKALQEKAEKQGGKLGAAPDGSFVLTVDINKILSSQEWNSIVSDKQRNDQAEAYLSQYATQLKEMGATDEQTAAEIENGRSIFKANIDAYRQSMMKDKSVIHDTIIEFAGGAGSMVTMLGGGAAKLLGADTIGDYLLDRHERVQSAVKDLVSNKVKLQVANKDYESEKFRQKYNINPEIDFFDLVSSASAVKLAYENGTLDSLITEQIPNIITSLGVGGLGKAAVGKFAATSVASKLPTVTKVLTGNLKTGSRVIDNLVLPAASGSGLALGGYGALSTISDAGAGAWQTVRDTDFEKIKGVYGESTWATAVREHGSEEAAREALADEAFNRAARRVTPVALATSFLGLEATIAGMMTRQAVKNEAKKLTAKGVLKGVGNTALTAVEEGFEEGYTQYASNFGAKPYTGIDLDSGVSDAIGIGALMGGGTTAVINALSSYAESKSQLPSEDFIREFVSKGNYNDAEFRQKFERQMAWFEKQYTKDGDTSVNDVQHYKQTYYNKEADVPYTITREDGSTDTKSIWDLMTPEQAQSFKDYVRLNYGINTNDYARHQDTVEYDAIKNNNMEVLSRPENADLLNVWRILNNTDTDQIPADKRDYYTAIAETTAHLRTFDNTHNTFQREAELAAFVNDKFSQFDDVSQSGIFDFGRTILGANSRRFTDAEQQAWNELQQQQGQTNGTNEQNQTDNSQSGGQGPIDENAEPVATQGGGTGTSQATTLRQAAEELADAFSGRPASPDTQSVGNGNPWQGTDISGQTNTPTTNGAGVVEPNAGVGQAQTTGDTVNTPATEIHRGASPQSGNTGQANQGGQSVGPTVAPTTQATTGGGGVGVTPTKRNSNGGGEQTSPKTANSLAETGVDIPIEVVQQFILTKKPRPKNLTLKKLREYVGGKLNVSIDKDIYGQAQVLQYLAKLSNKQFIAELSVVFATPGKRVTTNTQNTINDLHDTRHDLLKMWAKLQPKNSSEQATTDTNNTNGSQDVDDTNVADIADENPQAAVEQELVELANETNLNVRTVEGVLSGVVLSETDIIAEAIERMEDITYIRNLVYELTGSDDNSSVSAYIYGRLSKTEIDVLAELNITINKLFPNADTDPEQDAGWTYFVDAQGDYLGSIIDIARSVEPILGSNIFLRSLADEPLDYDTIKAREQEILADGRITIDGVATEVEAIKTIQYISREILSGYNLPALRADTTPAVVETPRASDRTIRLGTDVATDTVLDDETENSAIPPSRVRRTPTVTETTNANEQNQTQAEPREGSPVTDAPATQDGAGASGLVGDTQTTASQAEPVKPKRGGRSKKKTTAQLDLFEQEQTNATQNDLGQSVQSTQERTRDENQTDIVGNDGTTDDGQGEVLGQSGQPISEQSQESGTETTQDTKQLGVDTPAYYTDNLTAKERKAIKEIADNDSVDVETVYQAIADGNIRFFSGRGDSQGASLDVMAKELVGQEVATNMSAAKDLINRLTTPPVPQETQQTTQKIKTGRELIQDYLNTNPSEHATLRSYFNEQQALAQRAVDENADNLTDEIKGNYNLFKGSEIDFIEKMLGDRPFTDENIAQVIADTRTVYTAGITFDSLPTPVQNIIRKIWDKIKSTVAAVSMALAVTTGTTLTIPTEANATTPTETAVVQNIISQNDNQGKQFIVADKQAGTLTLYTPQGQQITSTPALFGKETGDSISINNATPSGRYDMNFIDGARIDGKGYGSSAQALSVNGRLQENNAGNVAIHRVLPIENRQGRLNTPTATDNRISHGCINVPVDFYDTHLDRKQDTVVYVMPETDVGRTGVFNVVGTSDLSRSENSVPTATQTATDTKEQVEPAYDNANSQSVEVTTEQLTNAIPHDQIKVAPKIVPTPLIVKGAEQSTQVAYTTPTVLGGANGTAPVTADRIVTPKIDGKVVHTPAEQRADTSFDTEPVKDKTDDGVSLAEVAVGLAAAFAGGMYVNRRRERAKAKKLESKKRTPVADNPPPTDSTTMPDPTPNMPQDPPTTEQVQDTVNAEHNEQVNKSANNGKSIPTNIKVPPQPTATALAVNREMWLKYLVETNQLGETGSQEMADLLLNTLRGFEYSNLAIMTDKSYQQANDGTFDDHRDWGDGEVNTDRIGIFNKFINIAAGATPIFDNLMGKLGIARGGHEADSSLASIALAQVKSKAQGAYAQIHKFFVGPMIERNKLLAQELRRGDDEIKLATGRVATAKHVLNEAADAMWRGFEAELAHLQDELDEVNADLAANPSNKDYPLRTMNTAKQLEDEIRQVSELYTRTRNMYEGKTAWDGETELPGGMTKARAEQDIAEIKAEYGADYAKIEENAKELVKTIRGIRQFATAAGVFTNADIEVFNELGFDEYVPLYSEEKDPTNVNEEDNYTQTSTMDRLMQGIPLTQARSMGLTKDLSRYRRKGAKSPAADGFTNMEKFAVNMAGRIGQQNWVEMNQQLYEGTVGKPYSAANITDPDTLADLNASYDSGKVPGLIRVRPGMKDFLPADVKAKIDKVRPIMGKGTNANGDTVAFEYYWTEPAIQAEIYANTDLSDTLTAERLRNLGTVTRAAARLVTVGKPVWSIYNFVRDSFERVSVMLMRPVKDQNGNLVPKWKLATAFFRALPTIVLNAKDIYRYLVLGEVKTPLQTMLNEAVGEGAINLMTTQTEKHSVIGDLKKSQLEKAGNKISKWLGDTANKTGAGGARNALTKGLDFYIVSMTEIPQVSTALASYMAYQNVGVNKKESANRVRDAYDPNRTNNKIVHNIGQFHPFVRSTFSGHYNLARSLTQYWKPGEWQFTLAYTLGGTLGVIGLLSMLAGAFDDDDDGRSEMARLPLSTLIGGIPVPWGENGVWTLPVGFGMNKLIWGIGANFYRYLNGYQSAGETAMGLAGLLVDNTSPVQATGGSNLAENPTAAAILTAMPMLLKPIVEMGFNTKAYGGGKIYGKDTPRDQLDSQQDNFNTPETYKKWAGWLNENGFGDYRPETLRHLFESYGNLAGPLSAIPQSVIADQSEKTLGNKERKGEVFGAVLTALGAGMSIQPNALDVANLTYEMDDRRYELHRKYGVGETHTEEIYEQYAQRGKRGGIQKDAKYVTEVRLREKGVPEEHIKYIVNGMAYQKKRKELDKEFKNLALEYNRLVASGKEDLQMRQSVQNAWDALEKLTNDYVKENNNVFFTLR